MEIALINRQRKVRVDIAWLRRFAGEALPLCAAESADGLFALKQMEMIDVAIVADAVIARVHEDFMDIPGATDVITFEHGEIVMSAETARMHAAEHGHTVDEELALYVVHGLLHLNGYDDREPRARRRMHAAQDRVWKKIRAQVGPPREQR